MTTDQDFAGLTREFGRSLTELVSPEEVPFFDELMDAHERPTKAKKDRALAFGIDEVAVVVALSDVGRVVLKGLWDAIQPSVAGVAQDAANEIRSEVGERIKKWIRGRFTIPVPLKLKPEEIQKIVASAEQTASQQGLDEGQVLKVRQLILQAIGGAA
jgi:hypothetical protein